MYKMLVPILVAGTALYAAEADPMEAVYKQLLSALEQETEALEKMETAADVDSAINDLRTSLNTLQAMLDVDARELWRYIDNTEGVKQPVVDQLELLALQFARLEQAGFFGHAELRELLSPQIFTSPDAGKLKHEKLREIDHDED